MIKTEGTLTETKVVNSDLWLACAGPRAILPSVGSFVVYFPQGHSEQVAASTSRAIDGQIPDYPNLQSQLVCQLHSLTLHANIETDEVFAHMTLQPVTDQEKDPRLAPDVAVAGEDGQRRPTEFFCKILTASDTSPHGGFSVPRKAAEKVFPPLDFTKQPPVQELQARDLHDNIWTFRHIYRGQPKRHLLTTGWSTFVSSKRLVAGDSVLFIRDEDGRLYLGIRRANNGRKPPTSLPSSVISCDSMHIAVLASAAHAAATNSCFQVYYSPRTSPSEFVIPWLRFRKAVHFTQVSVGMRFRMVFETEESTVRRHMGTVIGIGEVDPVRWPGSKWRSLEVGWDESGTVERPRRVSPWEIDLVSSPFFVFSPFVAGLQQQASLQQLLSRPPPPAAPAAPATPPESLKAAASPVDQSTFWAAAAGGECDMDDYMKCCFSTWLRTDMSSAAATTTSTSSNRQVAMMHLPPSSSLPMVTIAAAAQSQLVQPIVTASSHQQQQHHHHHHNHHHALVAHILQPHELQQLPYPIRPPLLQQQGHIIHLQQQQQSSSPAARIQGHMLQQQISAPPNFHAQSISGASSSSLMQRPAPGASAGFPDYEFQARAMVNIERSDAAPNYNSNVVDQDHGRVSNLVKLQTSIVAMQPPYSQLPPLPQTPPLPDLQLQPVLPQQLQISSSSSSWRWSNAQQLQSLSEQQRRSRSMPVPPLPAFDTPSSAGEVPWPCSEGQLLPQAKCFQFPVRDSSSSSSSSQCESSTSTFHMLPNIQIAQSESLSTVTSGSYSRPLDETLPATDSSSLILPSTSRFFHTINNELLPTQSTVNGNITTAIAGSFSSSPAAAPPASSTSAIHPDHAINHINPAAAGTSVLNSALNMPEWASRIQSQTTTSPAPVRTFTKVHKLGSVGRSIDLSRLRSYEELRREVARMFNMEGQLEDSQSWRLVFVDNVGDILLVGDDPWEEFVSCVRAIKILSAAQVMQMNEGGGGGWEEQQQHLNTSFPLLQQQQQQDSWRSNSSPDDHRTWN